jgi:GT2 family glycosyltransferase
MTTSVSIVLYHSVEEEIVSIISLLEQVSNISIIYLIDNGGSEFSAKLTSYEKQIIYIKAAGNIGYGAGHNIALRQAEIVGSNLHVVMNSDINFLSDDLKSFLERLGNLSYFLIAGPNIVNPSDPTLSYFKRTPSFFDMVKRFVNPRKYRYSLQIENIQANSFHCPYLSGAFIVFNVSELNQLGYFDERFFMYPEDIDISLRAFLLGGAVGFLDFYVSHDHRAESKKSLKLLVDHLYNMMKFYWKWNVEESINIKALNQEAGGAYHD